MSSRTFVVYSMTLFALADIPNILHLIYGYAVPVVIFAALYGLRWKVGMWGNCLSLGAVLFSTLIAIGWWEDVAELLAKQVPVILFLVDCIAFWVLFIVSLLILDTATRFMSTIKVKYNETVENVGNGIALFLLSLALFQVHTLANYHFGMVGEHPQVTAADVEGAMTNATIKMFSILSTGNLAAFTGETEFDERGNLRELHLLRRQAIMLNWMGENKEMRADEGLIENMNRRR